MKRKLIAIVMTVATILTFFTGCVKQDVNVSINKDGTGAIITEFGIEKEFYAQLKDSGTDPFEGKTVTEYEYDGSTYVSVSETKEYSDVKEIETALEDMIFRTDIFADMSFENEDSFEDSESNIEEEIESENGLLDITVNTGSENEETDSKSDETVSEENNKIFESVSIEKKDGLFYSVLNFNAKFNKQNTTEESYEFDDIYKFRLTLEFPDEIISSTGGSVEGNKIIFDLASIPENGEISASCESKNTTVIIGLVAGLILLVGGTFCIIKFKK